MCDTIRNNNNNNNNDYNNEDDDDDDDNIPCLGFVLSAGAAIFTTVTIVRLLDSPSTTTVTSTVSSLLTFTSVTSREFLKALFGEDVIG